jgi:hypothetical protein
MLDVGDDAVPLRHHHVVGESQRSVTGASEPGISLAIALSDVERAIELDDQPGAVATEVGDEAADGDLAAEMQAVTFAERPEPAPETALPAGCIFAELAREPDVLWSARAVGRWVGRGG